MTGLRPFFPYYGSKWLAARGYPPPIHWQIVDSFCGGAGYPSRYPDRDVLLVDLNPRVAAIWRWLIQLDPAELLALPDVPEGTTVDDFESTKESCPARDFVGFHLNPGNTIPGRKRSKFRSGRWAKHWSAATRSALSQQLRRIRHWRVVEGDYSESSRLIQGPATWFIDPPYSNSAGKVYRTPPLDYQALAAWVETLDGQVIVCEHDGADWLPFRSIWRTAGVAGESREAVYVRYSEVHTCPR
jgi:hypothetical protein